MESHQLSIILARVHTRKLLSIVRNFIVFFCRMETEEYITFIYIKYKRSLGYKQFMQINTWRMIVAA